MAIRSRHTLADLTALSIPISAVLAWCWPLLRGDVPSWGSTVLQSVPWWYLVSSELHQGRFAWWNPFAGYGAPLASNPQSAALSPFIFLLLIQEPGHAVGTNLLLHGLVASAGMYVAARRLGLAPRPAALAAVVFPLGLAEASRVIFPAFFNTAAWIGWAIAAWPFKTRRDSWFSLALVVVLALAWLDGHPQAWLLVLAAGASGWLPLLFTPELAQDRPGVAGRLAGTVVLASGLVSFQLVPGLELFGGSVRSGGLPAGLAAPYDPPIWTALLGTAPALLGLPASDGYRGPLGLWEWAWFAGTVPAALALSNLRRADRRLVVVGGVSLLLAYLPSLLSPWLSGGPEIPSLFRGSGRLLVLTDAALALLASSSLTWSLQAVRTGGSSRPGRIRLAIASGLILGCIAGFGIGGRYVLPFGVALFLISAAPEILTRFDLTSPLPKLAVQFAGLATVLATVVELVLLGRPMFPTEAPSTRGVDPPPPQVRLMPDSSFVEAFQALFPYRTMAADPSLRREVEDLPNSGWSVGRRDLPSYDPLRLETESRLAAAASVDDRLAARIGISLIAGFDVDGRSPAYRATASPLARLSFVTRWEVEENDERALSWLARNSEDRQTTVLSTATRSVAQPESAADSPVALRLAGDQAESITIEIDTAMPGILRVLDTYYPGWKAFVDGAPAEIHRVDYAFRGIEVPNGKHRIEMVYDPDSRKLGVALSSISAAFLVGILLRRGLRSTSRG